MADYGLLAVILAGLILRILLVAIPGNQLRAPWSGGGDVSAYVTLAENLLRGRGLSYAGEPTAFRPPGYPFLLAAAMKFFGAYYVAAVRCLQFALGLFVVCLCGRTAARAFSGRAWRPAATIALVFPTLAYVTGELLTECIGTFFAAAFLCLLCEDLLQPRLASAAGLGLIAGLAFLFRFNMMALAFVACWAAMRIRVGPPRWQRMALVLLFSALPVGPWILRNLLVFHGQVIFSTQAGNGAVWGVLAPQGRALPGESESIRKVLGWVVPADLETNSPERFRLPSEPELERRAWKVARRLWLEKGWGCVPLVLVKWARFWLSTDQIFYTEALPLRQRLSRDGGVLFYWLILALALAGWFRLHRSWPEAASVLLVYAGLVSVLHSPFMMITRYRVPLIDPMLASLAGGGWLALVSTVRRLVVAAPIAQMTADSRA